MEIIIFILLGLSFIVDGILVILSFTNLIDFFKLNFVSAINIIDFLINFKKYVFIIEIVFVIIFCLLFFQAFIRLGAGGDNPGHRSLALEKLMKYSAKLITSIITIFIFLVAHNKGKFILYIILGIVGVIMLFFVLIFIKFLIDEIIDRIHGL